MRQELGARAGGERGEGGEGVRIAGVLDPSLQVLQVGRRLRGGHHAAVALHAGRQVVGAYDARLAVLADEGAQRRLLRGEGSVGDEHRREEVARVRRRDECELAVGEVADDTTRLREAVVVVEAPVVGGRGE